VLKTIVSNIGTDNLVDAELESGKRAYSFLCLDNLEDANLYGTNLVRANLCCANLEDAHLEDDNLDGANLVRANLEDANLYGANLVRANLEDANLDGANLDGANLEDANLVRANHGSVCRMDFGGWSICIRHDKTKIGCQLMDNSFWLRAEPKDVSCMDEEASEWWEVHGPAVKAAIQVVMSKHEMSEAKKQTEGVENE